MKSLTYRFKNVFSFGNDVVHTINMDPNGKMWKISGDNGSGKSNIRQMMIIGLYGKCPGVNVSDIPNKTTPKGNFISVDIKDQQGCIWTIKRSFSPSRVSLYKNGSSSAEDKGGVSDTNEFIIKNILRIPYRLYNDIFMLSVDEIKSLTKLNAEDTRRVFDTSFDLSVYNDIGLIAAKDRNIALSELESYENKLVLQQEVLASLDDSIPMYENMLKLRDKSSVLNDIGEFKRKIIGIDERIEQLESNLSDIDATIMGHREWEIGQRQLVLSGNINIYEREISILEDQLKSYDNVYSIKSYLSLVDSMETKKSELEDTRSKINSLSVKVDEYKLLLDKEIEKDNEFNKRADEYRFWKHAYEYYMAKSTLSSEISNTEVAIMNSSMEVENLNKQHNIVRSDLHSLNKLIEANVDGVCTFCGSDIHVTEEDMIDNSEKVEKLKDKSLSMVREIKKINSELSMMRSKLSRLNSDLTTTIDRYKLNSYDNFTVDDVINGQIDKAVIAETYSIIVGDDISLHTSMTDEYRSKLDEYREKLDILVRDEQSIYDSLSIINNSISSEIYQRFVNQSVDDLKGKYENMNRDKSNMVEKLNDVKLKKELEQRKLFSLKNLPCEPMKYDGDINILESRRDNVLANIELMKGDKKNIESSILVLNEEYKTAINSAEVNKKYKEALHKKLSVKNDVESITHIITKIKRKVYILNRINAICMSPTGIKSYFVDGIIPFINSSVADILSRVRPDLSIQYDKSFSSTIEINGLQGINPSSGQKKIMDIIIFVTIVKYTNSHFPNNVVFYDESLDSISQHSKVSLLSEIKNILCGLLGINVFVTDQLHVENSDIFDSSIHMEFDGFSNMNIR